MGGVWACVDSRGGNRGGGAVGVGDVTWITTPGYPHSPGPRLVVQVWQTDFPFT